MTCEEALQLIGVRPDGQLSEAEEAQLQTHLEQCPACRAWLQAIQATEEQLRSLEEEVPEGLHQRIIDAVYREQTVKKQPRSVRAAPLAAAAVLAVVLGVGSLAIPKQQLQVQEPAPAAAMMARTAAPEPAAYAAAGPVMSAEEMAAAAQYVADSRGAEVVLVTRYLAELDECLCEPQPDGTLLYTLTDADGAGRICRMHAFTLYTPVQAQGEASVSYALVVEAE